MLLDFNTSRSRLIVISETFNIEANSFTVAPFFSFNISIILFARCNFLLKYNHQHFQLIIYDETINSLYKLNQYSLNYYYNKYYKCKFLNNCTLTE